MRVDLSSYTPMKPVLDSLVDDFLYRLCCVAETRILHHPDRGNNADQSKQIFSTASYLFFSEQCVLVLYVCRVLENTDQLVTSLKSDIIPLCTSTGLCAYVKFFCSSLDERNTSSFDHHAPTTQI
jgi:hypothetical protein